MNHARHTPEEKILLNTNDKPAILLNTGALSAREILLEEARSFNLFSDIFMTVTLKDIPACQHVLRVLTDIPDLIVKEVRSQHRISKITSHDVILDILAEDSTGKLYNIEIQRKDTVDHARRTRLYASMIDSEVLQKGKAYSELPDVYIIYISETDLWKAGRTSYPVKKYFDGTDIPYEDGCHILYVNAAIDDGTEKARPMKYFKTADPSDMSQGDLSRQVYSLKNEEGGSNSMCEVSDKIFAIGKKQERIEVAFSMHNKGYSDETIADILEVSTDTIRQWLSLDITFDEIIHPETASKL